MIDFYLAEWDHFPLTPVLVSFSSPGYHSFSAPVKLHGTSELSRCKIHSIPRQPGLAISTIYLATLLSLHLCMLSHFLSTCTLQCQVFYWCDVSHILATVICNAFFLIILTFSLSGTTPPFSYLPNFLILNPLSCLFFPLISRLRNGVYHVQCLCCSNPQIHLIMLISVVSINVMCWFTEALVGGCMLHVTEIWQTEWVTTRQWDFQWLWLMMKHFISLDSTQNRCSYHWLLLCIVWSAVFGVYGILRYF